MGRPKGSKNKTATTIIPIDEPVSKIPIDKIKIINTIPIYATENKVLNEMIKINCKANVKSGDKVFIQDNFECMYRQCFRINSGFYIINNPDNIQIIIENLRGYDQYRFKPGDHIADLIIS